MVSKKKSEELPLGWTEHVSVKNGKTTNYFTNAESSETFSSRLSLDRYLNSKGGISQGSGKNDNSASCPMDGFAGWLPEGWTVEAKRKGGSALGSVYKVYIEKSTGHKLYSKPQVLRYLEKVHIDNTAGKENDMSLSSVGKQNDEVNELSTGKLIMSEHNESMEDKCHISGEKNGPDNPSLDEGYINKSDGLPHGWIKELRPRKSKAGPTHDPFYIDPVSGYAFRSKKDVWRFMETRDISKCAIKPQKWDVIKSPSPANVEKMEHSSNTRRLLIADMAEKESEMSKEKEGIKLIDGHDVKTTRNEGFRQDSKSVIVNGVSSPTLTTAPSRKSKRKPSNVPQRSSKRLSVHNPDATPLYNLNEPTLSSSPNEKTARSSSCLSSEVAINGETQTLDTEANVQTIPIVATGTNAEAVNGVPQSHDSNIYTEPNNATVNDVPPQQLDSDTYTEPNNVVVNEVPPQQLVTNIYPESGNASVNEVPPQPLDSNIYTGTNNAAVDELPHQQLATDLYKQNVGIDIAVNEFVENTDATRTDAADAAVASQSRVEMDLNSTLELLFEDMDVQQQQTTSLGQGNDITQQKETDPKFQGDYWSDPCFDFSFKTLADGMPFEDSMELDSCFQTHAESSSYAQVEGGGVVGFVVPDMNAPPSIFKNDETYNLDPVPGPNPTCLPGSSASDSHPPHP